MDLRQLLIFIFRRLVIVSVCALAFAVFGWKYSASVAPKYHATAELLVSSEEEGGNYTSIQGSIKLIDTYNVLLKNRLILDKLIASLQLPLNYKELESKISVKTVEMSQVIRVTATDTNPKLAAEIVNGLVEIFQREAQKLFHLNNVYILHVVDDFQSLEPDRPSKPFYALLGFVGGGILSLGALLLGYLLSPFVNSRQELGGLFQGVIVDPLPGGASRRSRMLLRYLKLYRERWRSARRAWSIQLKYKIDSNSISTLSMFSVQHNGSQSELIRTLADELSGDIRTVIVAIDPKPGSVKASAAKELPESTVPGWKVTAIKHHERLTEIKLCPREGCDVTLADPALIHFVSLGGGEQYALRLLDLPPLERWPDVQWIVQKSDYAILVVNRGRTLRSTLHDWQQRLAELDIQIGRIVFLGD